MHFLAAAAKKSQQFFSHRRRRRLSRLAYTSNNMQLERFYYK
jgi:hypothetical protein